MPDKPNKDRWSSLDWPIKVELIKIYVKHGITSASDMRQHYNSLEDPIFKDRPKPKADLYNRLVDEKDNRRVDFGNGSYGTHLMSSANVDNKPIVFSQIQSDDNGNLKDYGDKALDRAIERGDTIQFSNDDEARWWAENNYKQFYDKTSKAYDEFRNDKLKEKYPFYNTEVMNVKANGGHLFQYGGYENNSPKRISSLLDPDKVRNRLPADASKYLGLDPFGITNTITAGLQYIFNNDNTVQDKLNEKYKILRKTDDEWKAYHKKLKKSGHNVTNWKTTKRRLLDLANDYIGLEDAKDIYLNTPQRSNTFYPSKERPTIGNIENVWASNYLSSPTVVEDYILPAIRNIRTKNTVKNAQGAPLGSIEKIGKSGKNGVSFLPILGHATVGYGTDPYRGSYVSYYDKWDVNMSGKKGGADVVKYILGGTPVNIYDRVYLDDYYGYNSVNDYKNSKKEDPDITYGGWLPEVDISASVKSDGGQLGHITPYGQWEYPHQVTTIPSNNITMQGVDYPVVGVSNTGDTKYMLPNMDYLFNGQYVTEYPVHKFQRGGNTNGISSGRWVQVDDETITPEHSLPPVTIEAEHPLWSLPWYKDKKNNPNINRYKDQLYNNWRRHNEAGKEYLKRVAGGLSTLALPIGGTAGFILGVPDLAIDFAEMTDKPSVSNATELTLDAPTRYGTELDNALISVLESNRYTKPLAKILQYNDALQYIGAANDASTLITGKSAIEHASK